MDEHDADLFEQARGLASASRLIQRATEDLVVEAFIRGCDVTLLARTLGLHRSTVYRLLSRTRHGHSRPRLETACDPFDDLVHDN